MIRVTTKVTKINIKNNNNNKKKKIQNIVKINKNKDNDKSQFKF